MIQRYLYDILTDGIAKFKADPTLFDELFLDNYEIESSEVEAIKTYFNNKGLSVVNGYSRLDEKFPLIAIILARENEITHFIGDDAGMVMDEDDRWYHADLEASIWEHEYKLPIFTEQRDMTAAYYEMVKFIMLAGLEKLVADGAFEFSMSAMDLRPDPNYMPENFFVRELTFRCQREFQRIVRESLLQKYYKVEGIHIDKNGSPRDVGNVKTLVHPYVNGEE